MIGDTEKALYQRTLEIKERAYAPYSKFLVGAVLRARTERYSTASTSRTPPTRWALYGRRSTLLHQRHAGLQAG